MKTTIAKTWSFDAAHRLPDHLGKCAQPHGHTYHLTVAVTGEPNPVDGRSDGGMVVDFGELEAVWAEAKAFMDHRDLNVELEGEVEATTCELLAEFLYDFFLTRLDVPLASVRVSETQATYAEVRSE